MLLGWLLLLATTSASSSGSDKVVSFYLENGLPSPLPHPKGEQFNAFVCSLSGYLFSIW